LAFFCVTYTDTFKSVGEFDGCGDARDIHQRLTPPFHSLGRPAGEADFVGVLFFVFVCVCLRSRGGRGRRRETFSVGAFSQRAWLETEIIPGLVSQGVDVFDH
jgi:hypothetical protein